MWESSGSGRQRLPFPLIMPGHTYVFHRKEGQPDLGQGQIETVSPTAWHCIPWDSLWALEGVGNDTACC